MIRDFSREDLAPAESSDTEWTLGAGALLTLGGGLLLLCAVCFGLGYMAGHRNSPLQDSVATTSKTKPAVVPTGSGTKPGAAGAAASPSQALVKPALGPQAGSAPAVVALQVQPAMTQVQGWMVQIAAVTHAEDAEVLVEALRKRGYSVTARREVSDSLIHVQTGPFVSRNDANAMRQKLLNDGYNAVVQ